jgi:hypothetical protein
MEGIQKHDTEFVANLLTRICSNARRSELGLSQEELGHRLCMLIRDGVSDEAELERQVLDYRPD